MQLDTLLITPPFTQLNTPYPATAYLSAFLKKEGYLTNQLDLSILLFNRLFSKKVLINLFDSIENGEALECVEVFENRAEYISKVDFVIDFLKHNNAVKAHQINHPHFLPVAHRFNEEMDWEWAFGNMGIIDKAKHKATLFIEEIGDFIQLNIDSDFAFTKYAEKISSAASSFDGIENRLRQNLTFVERELQDLVKEVLIENPTKLMLITIPFPGNLISALRIAQFSKAVDPAIKVKIGGGYCNTELRDLRDVRIFDFIDYMTLDDGEIPVKKVMDHINGLLGEEALERCFIKRGDEVVFVNKIPNTRLLQSELPTPIYEGLDLSQYISFLDVINPMHRLWSDGRWNKLTVAHGCYWKQCSFCDVTLPYIKDFQQSNVDRLIDAIECMVNETGDTGFHFVDEAAPPKVLKELAEKLIEREIYITWWTNIRFEKTFDDELCQLLAKSGCIAVTGGLEVASDRLLSLMKKGVDIAQVAKVTASFADAGIMVHAYLMYGFPTQTTQETIDSLEVVKQLFEKGCVHSAFWHRFSTTNHSPVGKDPKGFDIDVVGPVFQGFAKNDLEHTDSKGTNHAQFNEGLNKALYNYMQGLGFDVELDEWFEFNVPGTSLPSTLIGSYLT